MVTVMRAMATGMRLALMLALPAAGQAVPHARVAQGELAGTIEKLSPSQAEPKVVNLQRGNE